METNKSFLKERLHKYFHEIFETRLINEIAKNGIYKTYNKGEMLLDIGDEMTHIPLILNGIVKVLREDQKEEEILLYYLEQCDTCAISFVNCINQSKSMFRALVEEDTECILFPVSKIEDWMAKYKSWRVFIIDSYHNRLLEMADAIRGLAFFNLDDRIAHYLENQVKLKKTKDLTITHQDIAKDLHTSRVVVSRLLKTLENEGKIKLGRNKISICV